MTLIERSSAMRSRVTRRLAAGLIALALSGCMSGGYVKVHEPRSARPPQPTALPAPTQGAIYQGGAFFRPLLEDRKARQIGDIVVVQINEKLAASQQSKTSADRGASTSMKLPIIQRLPLKSFQGAELSGSSDTKFEGKGETSNNNVFTGTISVTVVEILQNGNMIVSGEKQIGINHNAEMLRFSGVVNPTLLQTGNVVNSAQVADARLEYIGRGTIDEAQSMPWLQRFFLNLSPF